MTTKNAHNASNLQRIIFEEIKQYLIRIEMAY